MTIRRFAQRLDPRLSHILNYLDGTTIGESFRDRAVELASDAVLEEPIDRGAALSAHLWLLRRVAGDGLPLTAAGYLKPADVRLFAAELPTMHEWLFPVSFEVHAQPVLYFREYLKLIGLLRKYKGTLRATRRGAAAADSPDLLWQHLADTLIPTASAFVETAGIVLLVHMATTDGRIDIDAVARTLAELGWSRSDAQAVARDDVYPVWNDLWAALGNVGYPVPSVRGVGMQYNDRRLSREAVVLARDALFTPVAVSEA